MWKSLLTDVPANGQVIWIRAPFYYSDPSLATYDSTAQSFTVNLTSIIYPAYMIGRWKVYTAPSPPPIGSAQIGVNLAVG